MSVQNNIGVQDTVVKWSVSGGGNQHAMCTENTGIFSILLQQMLDGDEESEGLLLSQLLVQHGDQVSPQKGQEMAAQMLTEFLFSQQIPVEVLPDSQLIKDTPGLDMGGKLPISQWMMTQSNQSIDTQEPQTTFQQVTEKSEMTIEVLGRSKAVSQEATVSQAFIGQMDFMASVAEARKRLDQSREQVDFALLSADLQHLQQTADSGEFLPTAARLENLQETLVDADILRQASTEIKSNLDLGKDQFVVKLKPEGLGEITVKLHESEGKILMSITATTTQAVKALSGGAAQLQEALRPHHAELYEVIQETSQYDATSQNLSQSFGGHQHQQFQEQSHSIWNDELFEDIFLEEDFSFSQGLESELDAYI